VKIEGIVKEKE